MFNAGASTLESQPESADASLTPSVTHFGINTLALEIAGKRILIDPLLVGNLEAWTGESNCKNPS